MQKEYLTSNLKELVDTLIKYSTKEDTLEFIHKTDIDIKYALTYLIKRPQIRKEVRKYLLNCYANQLLEKYKNHEIEKNEKEYELLNYACFINEKIFFKDIITIDYFKEFLTNTLNESLFEKDNTLKRKK